MADPLTSEADSERSRRSRSSNFFVYPEKSLLDSCDEDYEYGSDRENSEKDADASMPEPQNRSRSFAKLETFYNEVGQAFQDAVKTLSTASCEAPSKDNSGCFDEKLREDDFIFADEDSWDEDASSQGSFEMSFDEDNKNIQSTFTTFLKNAKQDMKKIETSHSTADTESTTSTSGDSLLKLHCEEPVSDAGKFVSANETEDLGFLLRTRSAPAPELLQKKYPLKKSKSYDSSELEKLALAMNRQMLREVSASNNSTNTLQKFKKTIAFKQFDIDLTKTLSDIMEEEDDMLQIDSVVSEKESLSENKESNKEIEMQEFRDEKGSKAFFLTRLRRPNLLGGKNTNKNMTKPGLPLLGKPRNIPGFLKKKTKGVVQGKQNEDGHPDEARKPKKFTDLDDRQHTTMPTYEDSFDFNTSELSMSPSADEKNVSSYDEECIVFSQDTGFEIASDECILFDNDVAGFEVTAPLRVRTLPESSHQELHENEELIYLANKDQDQLMEKSCYQSSVEATNQFSQQQHTPSFKKPIRLNERSRSIIAGVTFEVEYSENSGTNRAPKAFEMDTKVPTSVLKEQKWAKAIDNSHDTPKGEESLPVKTRVFLQMSTPKGKPVKDTKQNRRGWNRKLHNAATGIFKRNASKKKSSEQHELRHSFNFHGKAQVEPLPKSGTVESTEGETIDYMDTESSLSFAFSDSLKKLSMMQLITAINEELRSMNDREP